MQSRPVDGHNTHISNLNRIMLCKLILNRQIVSLGIRCVEVILPALQVQSLRRYAQRTLGIEGCQCCLQHGIALPRIIE